MFTVVTFSILFYLFKVQMRLAITFQLRRSVKVPAQADENARGIS